MSRVVLTAFLILPACDRAEESRTAPLSAPTRAPVATKTTTPPPKPPWFVGRFQGSYEVEKHRIERPSLQAAWLKDEGREFTGQGTVQLGGDERGELIGWAQGVLGKQRLVGVAGDSITTLRLEPEPLNMPGFAGVAECTRQDGGVVLRCRLALSSGDGSLVRKGSLTLNKVEEQR